MTLEQEVSKAELDPTNYADKKQVPRNRAGALIRRKVYQLLDMHLDVGACEYRDGWSDQKIAEAITVRDVKCSCHTVKSIRQHAYCELKRGGARVITPGKQRKSAATEVAAVLVAAIADLETRLIAMITEQKISIDKYQTAVRRIDNLQDQANSTSETVTRLLTDSALETATDSTLVDLVTKRMESMQDQMKILNDKINIASGQMRQLLTQRP